MPPPTLNAHVSPLPMLTGCFPAWECISPGLPCGVPASKLVHASPCRQTERFHPRVLGLRTELSVCPTCLEKQGCPILRCIQGMVPGGSLLALWGGPLGCSWQRWGAVSPLRCRLCAADLGASASKKPNATAVRGAPSSASRVGLQAIPCQFRSLEPRKLPGRSEYLSVAEIAQTCGLEQVEILGGWAKRVLCFCGLSRGGYCQA